MLNCQPKLTILNNVLDYLVTNVYVNLHLNQVLLSFYR